MLLFFLCGDLLTFLPLVGGLGGGGDWVVIWGCEFLQGRTFSHLILLHSSLLFQFSPSFIMLYLSIRIPPVLHLTSLSSLT